MICCQIQVCHLSQDSFYRVLNSEELKLAHENNYDFDCPESIDFPLVVETLKKLRAGAKVDIPNYDFSTHSRSPLVTPMYGASVIVFEGLFTLHSKAVRDLIDLKIFVDEKEEVCLERRIKRDIEERGRDLKGILEQYNRFVKPSLHNYINPTKEYANIIVPRGTDNDMAMDMIIETVHKQMCVMLFPLFLAAV